MGRGALLGGTTVQAEQRPKLRMLPTLTVTHPPTSTLSTRSLGSHTSRSLNESSEDEELAGIHSRLINGSVGLESDGGGDGLAKDQPTTPPLVGPAVEVGQEVRGGGVRSGRGTVHPSFCPPLTQGGRGVVRLAQQIDTGREPEDWSAAVRVWRCGI